MPTEPISINQPSFAAGELSPEMYGRIDLAKYHVGARKLQNMIVHRQGGTSNRPGTKFIGYALGPSRLISFEFSVEQAYSLEFSEGVMRIIKDQGFVLSPIVDSTRFKWTSSGSGTNEYYLEDAAGGSSGELPFTIMYEDSVEISRGVAGSLTAGTWDWGDNDTLGYDTAYVRLTGGTNPDSQATAFLETIAQIASPYAFDELALVKFKQSADTLFLTHNSHNPKTLTRTDHHLWTFANMVFTPKLGTPTALAAVYSATPGATTIDIDYKVSAVDSSGLESLPSDPDTVTTTNPFVAGETVALTWTGISGAKNYNIYKNRNGYYGFIGTSDHVGGGAGAQSFLDDNITPEVSDGPRSSKDPFAFAGNKPGAIGLFEQRVLFARTDEDPQKIWATDSGTLDVFTEASPIKDSDSIEAKLFSGRVNEIKHIVALSDNAMLFTGGEEWTMTHGDNTDAIAPLSLKFKVQSYNGSSDVPPIVIGQDILYIEPFGKVVRGLGFSFETDGFASADRSILSSHLFENDSIVDWSYQKSPESIIWCVMDSGALRSFTFLPEHQVWAWSPHDTAGEYESTATIPGATLDETYFVVRRNLNGRIVRTIEVLADRQKPDIEDAFFVDSGLSLDIPLTIIGIKQLDPVEIRSTAHGLSNGNEIRLSDIEGMTVLNRNNYLVANVAADTFTITDLEGVDVDGTDFVAYTDGGFVRKKETTISGLDHLENEAVSVLADGSVVEDITVSGGAITLPTSAARVHVGLPVDSYLETLDVEAQGQSTIQTRKKRIGMLTVRLKDTVNIEIGPSLDKLTTVSFRDKEPVGTPTQPFTGDKSRNIIPNWRNEGRIVVRQRQPLPMTILAVIPDIVFGDN